MTMIKKNGRSLIKQIEKNKEELLKDKKALERIELRLEERHTSNQ